MSVRLIAFDLDGTLAPSWAPLPDSMGEKIAKLLAVMPVAIVSGADMARLQGNVIARLPHTADLSHLHLLPNCGSRYMRHHRDTTWAQVYSYELDERLAADAVRVLEEEARRLGLWREQTWGSPIENRDSQVTWCALGPQAPAEEKAAWDPDGTKRESLRLAVAARLPLLDIRAGGLTSLDVTRRGIDKAHGLERLSQHLNIPLPKILYVGDKFEADGNDYPVTRLNVQLFKVSDWHETESLVSAFLTTYRTPQTV